MLKVNIQFFGGRGSSSGVGGVGQKFLSSLPDWQLNYIDNHSYMGNFGTKSAQEDFMRQNGVSEETLKEMNSLLNRHGLGGEVQHSADSEIVSRLQSQDDVGKALNIQIQMEEAMYSRWAKSHPNQDQVYRKGDRKLGVESWTTNEEGANMGSGGIGYDHASTISSLRSQGYDILGGIGRHLGSPGEAEVTMVKWR